HKEMGDRCALSKHLGPADKKAFTRLQRNPQCHWSPLESKPGAVTRPREIFALSAGAAAQPGPAATPWTVPKTTAADGSAGPEGGRLPRSCQPRSGSPRRLPEC